MDLLSVPPELMPRIAQWSEAAQKLYVHHHGFMSRVFKLGRLDCALRAADEAHTQIMRHGGKGFIGVDYPCLSELWVYGMYEILRTLDQLLGDAAEDTPNKGHAAEVKLLKKKFERLRVPLAKFEEAGSFRQVTHPPMNVVGHHGWSWLLNDGSEFLRNDLADETLALFTKFAPPVNTEERTRQLNAIALKRMDSLLPRPPR